jgi:hypothetical protein
MAPRWGSRHVDTAPFELLAPFGGQPVVVGACRDQQAFGRDCLAAVKAQHRVRVLERQAGDGCGNEQARAELARLHDGALR